MVGNLEKLDHFLSKGRLAEGPWQAFERGIARLLEHAGFKDVVVVGGSGDLGADVVATKEGRRWLIQAKYRTRSPIGKSAVEEAFNAMQAYSADVCVTATNQYFSKDADDYNNLKQKQNFQTYIWNRDFLLRQGNGLDYLSKNYRKPRPYQQEAIDEIYSSIENGKKKGLLTLATGLGKTLVASTLISKYLQDNPDANVLVLAHMSDLVRQLESASWKQLAKNVNTHVWTDGEKPSFYNGVIFATYQSIHNALIGAEIEAGFFDFIVVDECHHAPGPVYSNLLKDLKPKFLLGVTATPWRSDNSSLRELFGDPLFSMSVVEGMMNGFLAEVDYEMLTDDIDWDEINYMSRNGHTLKDLNQYLYIPERDLSMVERIVDTIEKTNNPRVLVFCRSIQHAEKLLNFFRRFDIPSSILHSKLHRKDRFKSLSNFRTGKLTVLLSIEMLNEGIDVPEVNIVCFARVTHSRRIFLQQLGRGLRLTEEKNRVKVLDFVADIKRIAQGLEMNREAAKIRQEETIYYPQGKIVNFSSDVTAFFDQYLEDMGDISNLDDNSRLEFPN